MNEKNDLQKENEELRKKLEETKEESNVYKRVAQSFWQQLKEDKKRNLEAAQKVAKNDPRSVANTILNMYWGHMPSDSVNFCEIFNLREIQNCDEEKNCTGCIDKFLRKYYQNIHTKETTETNGDLIRNTENMFLAERIAEIIVEQEILQAKMKDTLEDRINAVNEISASVLAYLNAKKCSVRAYFSNGIQN